MLRNINECELVTVHLCFVKSKKFEDNFDYHIISEDKKRTSTEKRQKIWDKYTHQFTGEMELDFGFIDVQVPKFLLVDKMEEAPF